MIMVQNIHRSGMPRFHGLPQNLPCADNAQSNCMPSYPSKAAPADIARPTLQQSTHPAQWTPIDQVGPRSPQPQTRVDQSMGVEPPLRSNDGKPARIEFTAILADDNTTITKVNGIHVEDRTLRQFFDMQKFQSIFREPPRGASANGHPSRNGFPIGDSAAPGASGQPRSAKKRSGGGRGGLDDGPDSPLIASALKSLRIDDSLGLESFYENRFAICQQNACKLIAKAWVKAIEPRKQSKHPYTGSDEAAPEWWPRGQHVPHTEPDHLLKPARLKLLVHMLRLVIPPPSNQHHAIRHLCLDVARLEALAYEALSSHFAIENNMPRRRFLVELFKVAKREERYLNGEIDGTTQVQVMADEKMREPVGSDHDDSTIMATAADNRDVPRSMVGHFEGPATSPLASVSTGQDAYFSRMPDRASPFHSSMPHNIHPPADGMSISLAMQTTHLASPSGEPSGDYNHMQRANFYNPQWQTQAHTPTSPVGYGYSHASVAQAAVPYSGHPVGLNHSDSFMEVDTSTRTVYE